mmetsp:Transcript_20515/g.33114  ORF Transcript_20515/g.33114 Transcript_20515/m.33114 type:complete len:439 (+) Transcript_20515:55-1371(+)
MPSAEAALGKISSVSVRNTFLHYNCPGSTGSCRSLSCPPFDRQSASIDEDADLICGASGEDTGGSSGKAACGVKGARPCLARSLTETTTSVGSRSLSSVSRAKLDKRIVLAAIARGPPPYAPPSRNHVSDEHIEADDGRNFVAIASVPQSCIVSSCDTGNEVSENSIDSSAERLADSMECIEVDAPKHVRDDTEGFVEVKRKKRPQVGKKGTEICDAPSQNLHVQPSSARKQLSGQNNVCLTEAVDSQGSAKVDHPSVDSQEDSTSADDNVNVLNDATDSDADDAITEDLGVEIVSQIALETAVCAGGQPDIVGSTSQQRTAPSSAHFPRSTVAGPPVHHEVHVGIEHTVQFPVVRWLIGPGGVNMRKISSACPSTKVELRGAGTNPWLGGESGPLVLRIKGRDRLQCAEALKLANELIDGVRKQYQEFLATKAKHFE